MPAPIVYIDRSKIRPGKSAEVKSAIRGLVQFVQSHEERIIAYSFFLDERETEMTLWQVHPDSASLEFHMEVAGPAFRPLVGLIHLAAIEIYGTPSEKLLGQLEQKATMLGDATVTVHKLEAGFTRFVPVGAAPR